MDNLHHSPNNLHIVYEDSNTFEDEMGVFYKVMREKSFEKFLK